jgi:hypothetical protein
MKAHLPLTAASLGLWFLSTTAAAQTPSFHNEVMAVLSKAGCNQGVCHGNRSGKGGFRLSLRGQDPRADYLALTHDQQGRRVDRLDPQASLLLRKPTLAIAHEGGRRFAIGSREYQILRDWIAAGAPSDDSSAPRLQRLEVSPRELVLVEPAASAPLSVRAVFADAQRDVTRLAVYETTNLVAGVSPGGLVERAAFGETTILVRYLDQQQPVRVAFVPARPDFAWQAPPEANYIDRHVYSRLKALRINPSDVCSDTVFVRRAYLDLLGLLPTSDEARCFAADTRPDKRPRLIDELLQRPEFAEFWALKWSDLLKNEERVLDRKGVQNFHRWIRQSIAEGKPLDEFARELVSAAGSTYAAPAANWYRANRDPVSRAEATAQVFLGVRLQCARCHNHPFDRWTQDDYYGWTAVFGGVDYKVLENRRRDQNDSHEFDGEQVVWYSEEDSVTDPRTEAPAVPRFLSAPQPAADDPQERMLDLARWLTRPDHPLFAPAQVNRIWYHLLGRGIVDPIDDFRGSNPPVNPPLLAELSSDFVAHRFDLRHMIRTIMNSRVYQHSSTPNRTNADDEVNFSRGLVRRLTAEQLLDAMCQFTGVPASFAGYPHGTRAGQIPGVQAVRRRDGGTALGDQFLRLFGKPPRLLTCECERAEDTTLGQAFHLLSGPAITELLTRRDGRLDRLALSGQPPGRLVEELFWTALSRPPTEAEQAPLTAYLERASDRRAALEDIAWGLMNSAEFLFRR